MSRHQQLVNHRGEDQMDKTYDLVGVSTQGKITKFRVANGDMESRIKVLERAGCTDINFIKLPTPLGKLEAIAAYKAQFPESEGIRMPNEKEAKPVRAERTVNIKRSGGKKIGEAATALLNDLQEV
jgi:hypothetical protein